MRLKTFKTDTSINTRLVFINVAICGAFLLIVIITVFAFTMIRQELKNVTNEAMDEAISNSKTARDVSKLFSDIDFLGRIFYGNDIFLKTEGSRLVNVVDNIQRMATDPELKSLFLILDRQCDSLLNQCDTVNKILDDIKSINQKTHEMLTHLEDLIADIIISHTLEGDNTDFAEQLLTLVIGYRENLLQIRNYFVELGHDHYLNFSGDKNSPVIMEIDDLVLRLQTITASAPNISQHGIAIMQDVERYKNKVLGFYDAMNKLNQRMTNLNHTKTLFITSIENIEQKVAQAVQDSDQSIDRIIFTTSFAVVVLAVIVILILGIATRYLVKTAIITPMNDILSHINSFKDGNLERCINLGRRDEWTIIERGLNEMAAELSKTYTTLEQNEKFLTTIIENIPHMVFVKDADNLRFVRFNKAGEDLLGYSRDALIGKNDYDFFSKAEADFFTTKDREVIDKGLMVDIPEESIQTRDKSLRTLHTKKIPIMDEHGQAKYLLGISEDITQRKALEEQLRQAHKMESIGTLAGGIAHDFNNILYMISGNAELAMDDIPKYNPAYNSINEIQKAAIRASAIVKQLLSFSRKSDEDINPIGAITVIKDALKFLRSTIPAHVEIRDNLPNTELTILGDSVQIHQMLMNLSVNAAQEMEETGGVLEVIAERTTLNIEDLDQYPDLFTGEHLKIIIKDSGAGIAPEHINQIFDPYFTTKEVGQGSGMGLAVVHGIVKKHEGVITVESLPEEGTAFTILFPLVDEKPVLDLELADNIQHGNERILFIDDEESITNMIQEKLGRLGYVVEAKTDPVEALELFKKNIHEFDLVITDMAMPQMSGDKLFKKIRDVNPDIPVIICTGYSPLMDEEKAEKLGISSLMIKPVKIADIIRTIRKVLDDVKH